MYIFSGCSYVTIAMSTSDLYILCSENFQSETTQSAGVKIQRSTLIPSGVLVPVTGRKSDFQPLDPCDVYDDKHIIVSLLGLGLSPGKYAIKV